MQKFDTYVQQLKYEVLKEVIKNVEKYYPKNLTDEQRVYGVR